MEQVYTHFDVEQVDGVTVVRLKDSRLAELVLISELHDELLAFVETQAPPRLLIDFSLVAYCSTAVINSILRAKKRMVQRGGEFRLCSMHRQVRESYQLLNLDGTVFEIYDTLGRALEAFGKPSL